MEYELIMFYISLVTISDKMYAYINSFLDQVLGFNLYKVFLV